MKRALLAFLLLLGCSKSPAPPRPPHLVTVGKVESKDMPLYYEYVGHIEANQSVSIIAQASGLVTGQYYQEGQEVKEGDLLLTIDPRPYEAALLKARGELAQSIANLKQARDTVDRYTVLVQENYVSQLDFDQFVTNVLTNDALVQQAQASVETAEINLSYCTITAPLSGIASKLAIVPGNYVPVGGTTALMSINQISPIRASLYIPEKDLSRIAYLQNQSPLKVVARVLNLAPVEGELMLIDNQVEESTGTILLQALFENKDRKLWPGQYIDVQIILETRKNAIVVSSQAVQVGQNGPYAYVLKADRTVELRNVKVAQKEGDITIIDSGLNPGETVVLEGQMNLKSGEQVAVKS